MLVLKHSKTENILKKCSYIKNIENFCNKLTLLTMLGEQKS